MLDVGGLGTDNRDPFLQCLAPLSPLVALLGPRETFDLSLQSGAGTLLLLVQIPYADHAPTHGYAERREAAMSAFAKSWRRA